MLFWTRTTLEEDKCITKDKKEKTDGSDDDEEDLLYKIRFQFMLVFVQRACPVYAFCSQHGSYICKKSFIRESGENCCSRTTTNFLFSASCMSDLTSNLSNSSFSCNILVSLFLSHGQSRDLSNQLITELMRYMPRSVLSQSLAFEVSSTPVEEPFTFTADHSVKNIQTTDCLFTASFLLFLVFVEEPTFCF